MRKLKKFRCCSDFFYSSTWTQSGNKTATVQIVPNKLTSAEYCGSRFMSIWIRFVFWKFHFFGKNVNVMYSQQNWWIPFANNLFWYLTSTLHPSTPTLRLWWGQLNWCILWYNNKSNNQTNTLKKMTMIKWRLEKPCCPFSLFVDVCLLNLWQL